MLVEEQPIISFHAPGPLGIEDDLAGQVGDDMRVINVRVAGCAGRREAASLLLRRMYAWRGYAFEVEPGQSASKMTLYAETGGRLVGTMSLCFDRGTGLPADEVFGDRLDVLRREGRRLCEPSGLAIDKGMSKRVFAALIHISYIYAHHIRASTDYVIEVNPRHVAFYRRMLGFAHYGGERCCARVGAPAVLLRLPLDYMGAQIRKWGGSMEQHGSERSFYPYFFPVWDEPGITQRLKASIAWGAKDECVA
jgi:hypothetical protein